MYKIIKELTIFILFAYIAVWICLILLSSLDLRSASVVATQIEEVFLVQLSLFFWFISLIILYIFRILFFFLEKKFNPKEESGAP
jgi:hypothetical protein